MQKKFVLSFLFNMTPLHHAANSGHHCVVEFVKKLEKSLLLLMIGPSLRALKAFPLTKGDVYNLSKRIIFQIVFKNLQFQNFCFLPIII